MIAAGQFCFRSRDAAESCSRSTVTPGEWGRSWANAQTPVALSPAGGIRRQRLIPLLAAVLSLAVVSTSAGLDIRAPAGMPTGKTVTAEQLWQEFNRTLPPDVWVSPLENNQYEVISATWIRRSFLPALQRQMKELRDRGISADNTAANCNGFALVCRLMLNLSAMEARARAPATATVIVSQEHPFGGIDASMENHCVAYVLTDEGPWIIEAQSGEYTKITDYPNWKSIKLVSVH
jgi:hypothetical protein